MTSDKPSSHQADILVVDDTPANLRLLISILSEQGYKVRPVLDGNLALQAVKASPPDLVLLDILMPHINGYEVCQQLKANPETASIPVIFLSALNEGVNKTKAFQVGGADYITKPFQIEEVLARIHYQLTLRNLQSQLHQRNEELTQKSLYLQALLDKQQQVERQISLLLSVTQAVSLADDLDTAIDSILGLICPAIEWDLGEAWIPNKSGTILKCSRGRYAQDSSLSEFRQHTWQLTFAAGREIPGQVWLSKRSEWIEDVSRLSSDVFQRAEIAAQVGLKAAFSVPILVNDQVLAILVFYQRKALPYQDRLVKLVQAVAAQLGSLIQRKQAEEALKVANEELERLASLDGLTGVANRRRFDDYLKQEWYRLRREQQPLSLIMYDVDYFKQYNDYYGHQAGDDCLKAIAQTVTSLIKRPADLLARYGGEEFVILLPNTKAEGALEIAETIRKEVLQLQVPHNDSPVSAWVTVSLGVSSIIPPQEESFEILIMRTDEALYQAKRQGRNQSVFWATTTTVNG